MDNEIKIPENQLHDLEKYTIQFPIDESIAITPISIPSMSITHNQTYSKPIDLTEKLRQMEERISRMETVLETIASWAYIKDDPT